ncbi:hypothetical protein C8R43DRAFT_1131731 [Mycena crocata]|nr:hypothetical protein C8R43DRAFT_1131731 [Mycena crocata]
MLTVPSLSSSAPSASCFVAAVAPTPLNMTSPPTLSDLAADTTSRLSVVVTAALPPPPPTTSTTPSTTLETSRFDSYDYLQVLHAVSILQIASTSALELPTLFLRFKIAPVASKFKPTLDSGPEISMRGFKYHQIFTPTFTCVRFAFVLLLNPERSYSRVQFLTPRNTIMPFRHLKNAILIALLDRFSLAFFSSWIYLAALQRSKIQHAVPQKGGVAILDMDKLGLELVRSRLTKASSFQDSLQVLLGSSLVNGFGKRMGVWGYNSGRSYAPNHAVQIQDSIQLEYNATTDTTMVLTLLTQVLG